MLMILIKILLIVAMLYGYGMWAYTFILMRRRKTITADLRREVTLYTFHLGICAIASTGFLGLILAFQGA